MNSYELSRAFWNFAFENPDKIKPNHPAIYFFAIEHCNRLGWKDKFGFPSQMVMEAIGIKNWRTYSSALNNLVEWGFIKMIETSKNQYSSNIIAIVKNTKATTKALDKALSKHSTEHSQSIVSIDKQETKNKEQETKDSFIIFWDYFHTLTKLKKTNRHESKKVWVKLPYEEQLKAYANVGGYYASVKDKNFLVKCRTYLTNKLYEDEFKTPIETKEEAHARKLKDSRTNR